jgi:hypothetical protein
MTIEIQLTLDAFAGDGEPLCRRKPELNGFKGLCYYCPHSERSGTDLMCMVSGSAVRARDKYSLKGWKALRRQILERDGERCTLCGASERLHIHHVNLNRTDDNPDNLLTLCEICHARIHTASAQAGGREQVEQVITFIRSGREVRG